MPRPVSDSAFECRGLSVSEKVLLTVQSKREAANFMRGFRPSAVPSGLLLLALFVPVAWPPAEGQQSNPAKTEIARVHANSSFRGNLTADRKSVV